MLEIQEINLESEYMTLNITSIKMIIFKSLLSCPSQKKNWKDVSVCYC